MINQYFSWHIRFCKQQFRSSLLDATYYRQQLFVIHLVIVFSRSEIFKKECHRIKFIILFHLRQNFCEDEFEKILFYVNLLFILKCVNMNVFITVFFNNLNICLQISFQTNETFLRISLINDFTIFAKFRINRR